MRNELSIIDWYTDLRGLDTDSTWLKIKNMLNEVTAKYVPLKKPRPSTRPVWMNREISRAMERKRRLWRRRAPAAEYNEADKKVRNLIRNAKRKFEKKLAENHGNSKPFYSYLKKKTENRSGIGPFVKENGTLTTSNEEMAATLNNFFCSVFTEEDPAAPQAAAGTYQYVEELSTYTSR